MVSRLFTLLATIALTPGALSWTYSISDTFVGETFLDGFGHQAIADPTHGRVLYVDQDTAVSSNLTYASGDTLILRSDDTTVLSATDPGRASVRIMSNKAYSTHVAVFDIRHMPEGCSTWPAAWETAVDNWPYAGEVDIVSGPIMIEGVNDVMPNTITVHTGPDCDMPATRDMLGAALGNNCDVFSDGNSGCGVAATTSNSYGPDFNANGGGWYAMERTSDFIRVFFWPRGSTSVPSDVTDGSSTIDTSTWGTPMALFPSTSDCDLDAHFAPNNIIINLTFCGDWAGNDFVYGADGCPGSCVDFVNGNPSAFSNAFWDIASLRVYE